MILLRYFRLSSSRISQGAKKIVIQFRLFREKREKEESKRNSIKMETKRRKKLTANPFGYFLINSSFTKKIEKKNQGEKKNQREKLAQL